MEWATVYTSLQYEWILTGVGEVMDGNSNMLSILPCRLCHSSHQASAALVVGIFALTTSHQRVATLRTMNVVAKLAATLIAT